MRGCGMAASWRTGGVSRRGVHSPRGWRRRFARGIVGFATFASLPRRRSIRGWPSRDFRSRLKWPAMSQGIANQRAPQRAAHEVSGSESADFVRGSLAPWLVFSDDWGRHPSSCQHLVGRLLPDRPVTWVNMIGPRRPSLDWATARRGLEKLGQWLRPTPFAAVPENLTVISPKLWPGFGGPWERRFNRGWLTRQLRPHIERMP